MGDDGLLVNSGKSTVFIAKAIKTPDALVKGVGYFVPATFERPSSEEGFWTMKHMTGDLVRYKLGDIRAAGGSTRSSLRRTGRATVAEAPTTCG